MSCSTATSPGASEQLALFSVRPRPSITIDYARPDGGPLTDADFDHLARIARAATRPTGN
ncbi:hypothetical protein I6J39_34975 (plasmid) [Streptomyces californicus]|uniref:Uncharacterized protein n=1 Tax=Streptomyces californicus TaxID=67351 RepID=A0ABX7JCQ7_9ACTN|nr:MULTISPECIES: hypothetical protein [Streptomyces]QRV25853.1 hypothetical protein I6J39_00095 [Streptomyces californicus]QRV32543.1 hypothetical protein I6J39_34975 [Streptomyces californicus]QRV45958.1 hypothetical protein I6J41_34900 [Streptomyces californicus]